MKNTKETFLKTQITFSALCKFKTGILSSEWKKTLGQTLGFQITCLQKSCCRIRDVTA